MKIINRKSSITIAVLAAMAHGNAMASFESVHIFSTDDVLGTFQGATYGPQGTTTDPSIISSEVGYVDKSGVSLYPVDSEFGYYVFDFLGARVKVRDFDYAEGFVGNEPDGGIRVSNSPTLTYKVKPPLGTWCQGIGGTSVKCETEHYSTMEHVLTCHETIPYMLADPITGVQKTISTGDGLSFDCANAGLDDNTMILEGGVPMERFVNPTPCDENDNSIDCQMFPNDKTDMLNNIALSSDYSMQLKDDGKVLYGWGGLHKRPSDVRIYARLALPEEWKAPGADFTVTSAYLEVDHLITNNPNDQIRPEDLENEAATGRQPSYKVTGSGSTEVWESTSACYEGDGDLIESGTVLRNMPFALAKEATPGTAAGDDPYALSEDLYSGFTNAYYTTINRDPFEWSYVASGDMENGFYNFIGTLIPKTAAEMEDEGLVLVSGPRWRLRPNKFGQDLPGLEIPKIECSAPPFKSDNIKYDSGERVTTIINLLDWDESEGPSPLATSKGWVDVTENQFVTIAGQSDNGVPYTTNGIPMTDDFDVAFYIKGDSKPTAIYSAKLILNYEGQGESPLPTDIDMELANLVVPSRAAINSTESVIVEVVNNGPADATSGTVIVKGISSRGEIVQFDGSYSNLSNGESQSYTFSWETPSSPSTFNWTATVSAEDDTDASNDSITGLTRVRR